MPRNPLSIPVFRYFGISLILLSLGFGLYFYLSRPTWQTYRHDELGIQLQWPNSFQESTLTEEQNQAKIVFRITRENPKALFSLRYEDGLGPLKFSGGTVFDALVAAVNRRYPDRFPNYKKERYEELVLANEKATLFEFTYTGADGATRMRQRLVLLVRENTAYYLSFQAPESEFPKSEKDFEKITESFSFL